MSNDSEIQQSPTTIAPKSSLTSFDVTERTSQQQIRREIIRLFRTTTLSPREVLDRLMEHFYSSPINDEDRRTFLRHVTVWVREEVLIRGAAEPVKPNPHSDLLKAFRHLDRMDPEGARILELAYAAEITPAEIADVLNLAPEKVAKKLQWIQTWLRRVAEGEPLTSYQTDLS
jgi:hypothetical protein